uniref:Dimer_Tnp_hAT domain-containing protein n=1 Tax=Caenorhabditis tropicalis TaxID=1561998 RepID=A0A1I7V3G1_9PELO
MTDGYGQFRRDYHFYSVHIAYTDENYDRHLKFVALNTVESKNETGISSAVCEILQKCGLKFSNCSVLMADGASPLILLADKHQIDRVHCACHQLNLVIKDFATTREVANCQMRAEHFARHLSKNSDDKHIWIDPISWEDVEKDIVKYDTIPASGLCPASSSSNSDTSFDAFVKDRSFIGSVNQDDLKAELIRYKALLATNRPSIDDPLQFWRVQASNFPRLCGIAKELLSSPASSSASERCFRRQELDKDEANDDCDYDWEEDEEEEEKGDGSSAVTSDSNNL